MALCLLCAGWAAGPAFAQATPGVIPTVLEAPVSQLAVGYFHNCALTTTGSVLCWGGNGSGQLGDGTTDVHETAVAVAGLGADIAAVTTGEHHSCALTTAGAVKCWGANDQGQLGNGDTTDSGVPVAVSGLGSGVAAIAAGRNHTCALTTKGAVQCWGYNAFGQLGDGSLVGSPNAVAVSGLGSGVAAITGGAEHSCALTTAGAQLCWGQNWYGQLGDGSRDDSLVPVAVSGLSSGVAAIQAGYSHTCALTEAGALKCWGQNLQGQLGDGTQIDKYAPADVSGLGSGVASMSAGRHHTCAQTTQGALQCWGNNQSGQLGDGSGIDSPTPVAVSSLASGVAAVGVGDYHGCVLTREGTVKCWGANMDGQLGNGGTDDSPTPVVASGLGAGVAAFVSGFQHTCALSTAGGVLCWGDNAFGQLGDGSTDTRSTPGPVTGLQSGVVALSAGAGHTCALTAEDELWCWGLNATGQLGNGSMASSSIPVAVSGLAPGVDAIATGSFHTCAKTAAGALQCWGRNEDGQLGDGSSINRPNPVSVNGLIAPVAGVAAGAYHSCALTTSNAVQCWGRNEMGQLGDGSLNNTLIPVTVNGLGVGTVNSIALGEYHSCVTTDDPASKLRCWGRNDYGQLGNGSNQDSATPVATVGPASQATQVRAGGLHTCALIADGSMYCWGGNDSGQIGDGTSDGRLSSVAVTGLDSAVTSFALGNQHSCALTETGVARCWGRNLSGQLGDGSRISHVSPFALRIGQSIAFTHGNAGTPLRSLALGSSTALAATTGGEGVEPVSYATWTPDVCTVTGNTLTTTAAAAVGHLCGVTASRAGEILATSTLAAAPQQQRLLVMVGAAPTVALASSANPSALGEAVTLTATLAGSVNATGNVVFVASGVTLCTATVSAGVASCTVSGLTVGSHAIVASYAGDANNDSADSNSLSQVVNAGAFPLPGGPGNALVDVQGPPGCVISAPQFSSGPASGTPALENATFPLGIFSFTASGNGCTGATLNVKIDYPPGRLSGLQPYKFAPPAAGDAARWFIHGAVSGDSVSYSVQDNGVGDNNLAAGLIDDPFGPALMAGPPAGTASIPTLGQWGLMLMSALLALFGMARVQRRH